MRILCFKCISPNACSGTQQLFGDNKLFLFFQQLTEFNNI